MYKVQLHISIQIKKWAKTTILLSSFSIDNGTVNHFQKTKLAGVRFKNGVISPWLGHLWYNELIQSLIKSILSKMRVEYRKNGKEYVWF